MARAILGPSPWEALQGFAEDRPINPPCQVAGYVTFVGDPARGQGPFWVPVTFV